MLVGRFIIVIALLSSCSSFSFPPVRYHRTFVQKSLDTGCRPRQTALSIAGAIIDVPDGFFTITFPLLGVMLQVSKQINRARLEERAFDLRLKEARERKMAEDPSLTESELIRQEAAQDYSYYGPEAVARREKKRENGRKKIVVIERDDEDPDGRQFTLSDEEIEELEAMGVEYDPYYDDPYTEDELPDDEPFRKDKRYGDRIYESGEVFYKDSETGLYYRQGAKPRISTFWTGSRM